MRCSILLLLVAAPVRAGHGGELEGVGLEVAGSRDVGSATEVEEAVLLIGGDGALESLDQVELEGLLGEQLPRFVFRDFLADELGVSGDDTPHLLLDVREILGQERARN